MAAFEDANSLVLLEWMSLNICSKEKESVHHLGKERTMKKKTLMNDSSHPTGMWHTITLEMDARFIIQFA